MVNLINAFILFLAVAHMVFGMGGVPRVWNPEAQDLISWLLRVFAHAGMVHLMTNLWGLWKISGMAEEFTVTGLMGMIIFIWVVSTLMLYVWNVLVWGRERIVIGVSGVVFGLFVVFYYLQNGNLEEVIWTLVPSILPHLIMPNISFMGHFIGILSGLMYVKLFLQ